MDGPREPGMNKDNLIHKLKQRIQERDRALEVNKHTHATQKVFYHLY